MNKRVNVLIVFTVVLFHRQRYALTALPLYILTGDNALLVCEKYVLIRNIFCLVPYQICKFQSSIFSIFFVVIVKVKLLFMLKKLMCIEKVN